VRDSQAKALFAQRGYRLMACGVCELFFIDPYPRDIDRQHEVVATHAYEDFQLLETAKHYEYEVNFYRNYFELIQQECVQASLISQESTAYLRSCDCFSMTTGKSS
jgi:hypothetical protein